MFWIFQALTLQIQNTSGDYSGADHIREVAINMRTEIRENTYTSPSILCSGVLWKDFCGCPMLMARVRRRSTEAAPPLRPPMAIVGLSLARVCARYTSADVVDELRMSGDVTSV